MWPEPLFYCTWSWKRSVSRVWKSYWDDRCSRNLHDRHVYGIVVLILTPKHEDIEMFMAKLSRRLLEVHLHSIFVLKPFCALHHEILQKGKQMWFNGFRWTKACSALQKLQLFSFVRPFSCCKCFSPTGHYQSALFVSARSSQCFSRAFVSRSLRREIIGRGSSFRPAVIMALS